MTDLSEEQLDRARAACLFDVDEGELMGEPFDGYAYWIDGPPEWAEGDFSRDERHSPSGRFRTIFMACFDGKPRVPEGWRLVRVYNTAPERDCAWCGAGTGNEEARAECKLCEGDGHLYWGEEWCEVVVERSMFPFEGVPVPGPLAGVEDGDITFLGSWDWPPVGIVELWRVDAADDVSWVAVWGEEWGEQLVITDRLLRRTEQVAVSDKQLRPLRPALSWLVVAEERWRAQEKDNAQG